MSSARKSGAAAGLAPSTKSDMYAELSGGVNQIPHMISKLRDSHQAASRPVIEDDDMTYVSTYSDIHGSRLNSLQQAAAEQSYRPMRRTLGDKNAESKADLNQGPASKRRGSLGAFADSFNTQLREEQNNRQETRSRALDDAELHRMHHQQSSSSNNNNRREYRRNDVVAVQYLTPSRPRPASAPRPSSTGSRTNPAAPASASASLRHSLAAPSFTAEPRLRTNSARDDARYFSAAPDAPSSSSSSRSAGMRVRSSYSGPYSHSGSGSGSSGGGGEPDPMREWLRPTKREDPTKCTVRPPPFHVDTLKAILKAASQGRLGATTVAALSRGGVPSSSSSSSSRQSGRQSLDSGLARLAAGAGTGASAVPSDTDAKANPSSLLYTLQNVADDTSYQAHFDKIRSSPPALPAERERGARDYTSTPGEESKQSTAGVRPQLTDTGHGSRASTGEGRLHKQASRDTNSRHMDGVLTAHQQTLRHHAQTTQAALTARKNQPSNVAALEATLARQLPAGITGLRHALRRVDPSHSGLVNFEEFKSVLSAKASAEAHAFTSDELRAVFDACSSDCLGRGAVNASEAWRHDARYSDGRALHIEAFADRLSAAAPAQAQEGEALRAMKKVLHASNKQSDPLRVFSQLADPQQLADTSSASSTNVRGVVVGHVLPQQLKEGLNSIGAALTDREFSYLMQAVEPGTDGKISLADFDAALHRRVAARDQQSQQARRVAVEANPRYSRTFHVSEAVHSHIEPEFASMTASRLGRGDGMKWGKLQGKLQESCGNFASAFRGAAVGVDASAEVEIVDTMSRSSTLSTPSHRPAAAGRRSLTVVRPSSAPAGGARRSRSLTDYYRGGSGVALSMSMSGSVNGSGNDNGSLVAGTRPNRFYRDDSFLPTTDNTTSAYASSTAGSTAAVKGSGVVPVNRLRDVLSDTGVQLGADDAARLEDLVRRAIASRPSDPSSSAASSGAADGPVVSLDRFCEIVGIARVPHATQRSAVELADPRTVPADGGVFSHSLVASTAATHVRPSRRPASASTTREGVQGEGLGGSVRATDQLARLRDQQAENQLVNFSTTYMSEDALRQPTPTHAEGSRRRVVPRPEAQLAHATQPSLFWEMQHATNRRDIFPATQKSLRDPWQPDDFVSGYSLMRYLDKRPSSASAGAGLRTPATPATQTDTPYSSRSRAKSPSPTRFKATSPSRIPSPLQILMRGRDRVSSELDQSVQFQPSAAVARTARKRASSAPAGTRLQQTVGDVVFGSRNSMAAPKSTSGGGGGGGGGGSGTSSGESKGGEAPGMMRWASKTLADFIDTRSGSNSNSNSSGNAGANPSAQQQQQAHYSLRRGAHTRAGSLGDGLVPTAANTSGSNCGTGSVSGQSVTAHSVTGGAPYSVNIL